LLLAAPEAWFGDEGLFCNGTYMPWILSGRFLLKASAASDPQPELTLTFQSFNGSSSTLITQRIPIPDGHISDLLTLQEKLRTHCPTASVHLTL
jgi:TfoX/Sxy family transcriptional regulator of competence genes